MTEPYRVQEAFVISNKTAFQDNHFELGMRPWLPERVVTQMTN